MPDTHLGHVARDIWDIDLMEPRVRDILNRKMVLREQGPYAARTNGEVDAILRRAFRAQGLTGVGIRDLARMSGGASKEQFGFVLTYDGAPQSEHMVLRMDPLESIAQTCRGREAQMLLAVADTVPVPPVRFYDAEGDILGQPGLITGFVHGVTKPSDVLAHGVSGIGSRFDDWAPKLAPQFIGNLVKIHDFDWESADLPLFTAPRAGTQEAALFQLNAWAKVWWQDVLEPVPVITLTERWLRENAPICEKPVLVHCDLRIGNFMFEEPSGRFTAILDWELAHIGDFHEDIAWAIQKLFGTWRDDGEFLVCGLLPRQSFLDSYQSLSGNVLDPMKLLWYEVLNAYKCAVMDLGAALMAAEKSNNHQDLVLTWLGSAGSVFLGQMVQMIRKAEHAAQH